MRGGGLSCLPQKTSSHKGFLFLKTLLKALKNLRGSTTVPGSSFDDIEYLMGELYEQDLALLATDYIDFLYETNGFLWNGIEFYGTHPVEVGNFEMRGLMDAHYHVQTLYSDPVFDSKLVLGKMDDDLYIYDGCTGKYEILDRADRAVMDRFDNFEDMIRKIVNIPK